MTMRLPSGLIERLRVQVIHQLVHIFVGVKVSGVGFLYMFRVGVDDIGSAVDEAHFYHLPHGNTMEGDIFISSMPIKDLVGGMNGVPKKIARIAAGLPYRDYFSV